MEPPGQWRGSGSRRPTQIPPKGWWDVARYVQGEVQKDNVTVVAGGVAFFAFLALFPALAAVVSLYGLFSEPTEVQAHLLSLSRLLPVEAREILSEQLTRLTEQSGGTLSVGAVLSLLFTLWSANRGTSGLLQALTLVHDREESRGFFVLTGQALLITIGALVVGLVALGMVVAVPTILGFVGLEHGTQTLLNVLRWPVVALMVLFGLAVLYRVGPDRDRPRWRWVTPGALLATLLWLAGSAAFSLYVNRFARYDEMYGSAGALVVLLVWLFVGAWVVLLGAEVNAGLELLAGEAPSQQEEGASNEAGGGREEPAEAT